MESSACAVGIVALDVRTGEERWRAYNTGPDNDVLIGEHFQPFYPGERGKDLEVKSWPPEAWKLGGGTVWGMPRIRRPRENQPKLQT